MTALMAAIQTNRGFAVTDTSGIDAALLVALGVLPMVTSPGDMAMGDFGGVQVHDALMRGLT